MEPRYVILFGLLALVASVTASVENKKKNLGIFNIVRFPNEPCAGTGGKNGTCYTNAECENNGGTTSGECADGYGVCCVFTKGCGSTVRENCTYFESDAITAGQCDLEVCKCSDNICQLRLDFNTFVITGPSTDTRSTVVPGTSGIHAATQAGISEFTNENTCATDTFSVTNPGGLTPSVICGRNTGEHMYVDASDDCNTLAFLFGAEGVGTTLATRAFNIKVTQYSCDYKNLAPPGCTQYFFDASATGVIKTFNFDGGRHLNAQNQNICIRREANNCKICWSVETATDFSVSGSDGSSRFNSADSSTCCGYGSGSGIEIDCLVIPGARRSPTSFSSSFLGMSQFCGRNDGLRTSLAGTLPPTATICSTRQPFTVRFLSDQYEVGASSESTEGEPDKGVKLYYSQTAQNCFPTV